MSSKNFKNSGPTLGHFGDTPTPYTAQLENPPLASLAGREKSRVSKRGFFLVAKGGMGPKPNTRKR